VIAHWGRRAADTNARPAFSPALAASAARREILIVGQVGDPGRPRIGPDASGQADPAVENAPTAHAAAESLGR
jgi:hypothetical protein